MEFVKHLAEMAREEAADACKYARLAVEHKAEHPQLAATFAELAAQELQHMDKLHAAAETLLAEKRANLVTDGSASAETPFVRAEGVVDYLCEKQAEKATMAKVYLAQYKGA